MNTFLIILSTIFFILSLFIFQKYKIINKPLLILLIIILCNILYMILYISINNKFNIEEIVEQPSILLSQSVIPPSTTAYNAKLWPTIVSLTPQKLSYPEFCSSSNYGINIPDINKVSIAISGGGSRSFTSTLGYFRALNRMGYKNKAQYVSSVSGGSWFYGLYSFCQTNPIFTDSIVLGNSSSLDSTGIPDPTNMTISNLKTDNKNNSLYYGHIFENKDIIDYTITALLSPNITNDLAYNYAIGKLILDPYGLNNDVPIAINDEYAKDISTRNIFEGKPLSLPPNMPFWICNTSLFFNYVNKYPYLDVQMTPLYSGIPQVYEQNNNKIGGTVIDNFAFGNSEPQINQLLSLSNSNCVDPKILNLKKTAKIRTLRDFIGTSSSAFAAALYRPEIVSPILSKLLPSSANELIAKYAIWGTSPPIATTNDSQCTSNILKGGCDTLPGYDINSCSRINAQCYSNSATQCNSNNKCKWNWGKGQCANTNSQNSDLNCRSNKSIFNPFGCKCVNSTPYVQKKSEFLKVQNTRLSDGAFADNNGVIPLLSRGVKKIILFSNTGVHVNLYKDDGCDIMGLFGLASSSSCEAMGQLSLSTVKVFNSNEYTNNVLPQFQATFNNGGPCFSRTKLQVLPNVIHGIEGNYEVDILMILLQPASKFLNKLPLETKNEITFVPLTSIKSPGLFNDFPLYATFFQNLNAGLVSLTLEQSNFLSSYTDWCLNQPELKVHIQEMFNL